jgi:hypothetical protein
MLRALSLAIVFAAPAFSGLSVDIRVALGDFYRRPQREIVVLEERRVPPDEMPVVLFIAGRAGVDPFEVWEHRRSGLGWARIAAHYRLGAEVFYVPISVDPGPPYGRAYGYYRRYPRGDWHRIRLEDDDIVALVNLRFYSEHYRLPPDRIVVWHREGGPFYRVVEVADREHWKDRREREKDRREAEREWDKDRREAVREAEKDAREARREWEKDQREDWKERHKRN